MTALRIGILGAAHIARAFCTGVRGSDKVVVAAVASRKQETADAFAREFGIAKAVAPYEALLADPEIDAIYNPLPNGLHAPWSIRAVEAGKHVLCEKPLGPTAADVRAMQAAAARAGKKLAEAYPYLSQPQTLKLRELARDGVLGGLRQIHASFGFTLTDLSNVRFDPALGGGAMLDVGCYPLSLTRVLAGERARRVSAIAGWHASGVDMSVSATLEFASGLIAQISCAFDSADHRHALIIGEQAVVETHYWNHTTPERPATLRIKHGLGFAPAFETLTLENANGFRAEADAFADYVAGGAWNGADDAASLDIALMLDAVLESARRGAPVDLA